MTDRNPIAFLFNGDADGIIAQHILHLEGVDPDIRVTGVKRDIKLLRKLNELARGDAYVFDISLKQNHAEAVAMLSNPGVRITWFDHHEPGNPILNSRLTLVIDESPEMCTSVIVSRHVHGAHPLWAATAAFGDNLDPTAMQILSAHGSIEHAERLKEMGVLFNYNSYGETEDDLLIHPAQLAEEIEPFNSPLAFLEKNVLNALRIQFENDKRACAMSKVLFDAEWGRVHILPAEKWARRYGSTWANEMAAKEPHAALAVLMENEHGDYVVSVRAPKTRLNQDKKEQYSAAEFVGQFPTGGGRQLAAGINRLPKSDTELFLSKFQLFFK